jgi:hypothetical protein
MLKPWSALLICLSLSISSFAAEVEKNLVPNPGFEEVKDNLPANWKPLTMGPAAQCELDRQVKHGGAQSVRISASEVTRTYVLSEYVPVAPGESISASAWIKCKDVPEGKGTAIVIGEFSDSQGRNAKFVKFDVANVTDQKWQQVKGTQKVPEAATRLRLRIGFSYSYGTLWIDDVAVHAEQPIVATIGVDGNELSPGLGGVPVEIFNRAGLRGSRQVRVELGKSTSSQNVTLDGKSEQRVLIPVEMEKRGKQQLVASLLDAQGNKVISSEKREMTIPPPVVLLPPSPTHWAVEDGAPTIDGEIQLAMADAQRDGAAITVKLLDSNKQVKSQWDSKRGEAIPDGIVAYQIKSSKLPIGDYTLVCEVKTKAGKTLTSEQPWGVIPRAMAKTTINADGYCVINGKVIFPLGIFNGGKFKEQADAGFTVSHAYNAMRVYPGVKADDQLAKNFLDNSYKNGLYACAMVPMEFAYVGRWDEFRARIRKFRNHPGLLCWDEEESLARGTTTMDVLAKMRQIVAEEDPNHPMMVGDARDAITRVTDRSNFFPLKYMDLGMWWWYPIPLQKREGAALEGEEASASDEMTPPTFLVQRNTDKPLWVGVQSYKKNEKSRYPNYTEYRAQAYIALIHGAKGLMWYGGSVSGGIFLDPKEGHWDDLKNVATELNLMIPVFLSPAIDAPKFSPANAPMSVMLKKAKDGPVLIVANRGASAIEVTFDVSQHSGSAKVLNENRSVRVSDGALKDQFEPYEVHAYSLLK